MRRPPEGGQVVQSRTVAAEPGAYFVFRIVFFATFFAGFFAAVFFVAAFFFGAICYLE